MPSWRCWRIAPGGADSRCSTGPAATSTRSTPPGSGRAPLRARPEEPGRDEARAGAALGADLDAVAEAAEGYEGAFKVQVLGPWTLCASLELPRGEKALADQGAVRDLAVSLGEGITAHLAAVSRRLPGVTRLVVQVDEPLLAAVLGGELATQSGWGQRCPAPLRRARAVPRGGSGRGGLSAGASVGWRGPKGAPPGGPSNESPSKPWGRRLCGTMPIP